MDYINIYMETFINRPIWHRQVVTTDESGKVHCEYYLQKTPLTRGLVNLHLYGSYGDNDCEPFCISISAIDDEGYSKWCVWDDDTDSGAAEAIYQLLKSWKLNPVRESVRESRGGHVWLFFTHKIRAENLLAFNQCVQRHAKVCTEFFPKSSDKHSQIRAPLGLHRKPDPPVRGYFEGVKRNVLAQLKWVANELPRSDAEWIERTANAEMDRIRLAELRAYRAVRARSYDRTSILPLIPHTRRVGGELCAPCPICRSEGHDKSGDNLRITHDGMLFTCSFQGMGVVHKAPEIRKELERLAGGT